jgi:hypothetical protein
MQFVARAHRLIEIVNRAELAGRLEWLPQRRLRVRVEPANLRSLSARGLSQCAEQNRHPAPETAQKRQNAPGAKPIKIGLSP